MGVLPQRERAGCRACARPAAAGVGQPRRKVAVASGLAQLAWPVWLLLRRWRPLLALGALGNGLIVALWGVDRIWGLPIGPEHWKPEPVGFGDSVTAAFELLLVAGCVALLARDRERPLRGSVAAVLTLTVVALTALSLLSVLGVGASVLTPTE